MTTLAAVGVAGTQASIFWEKLSDFYADMTFANWQQAAAWQIGGLVVPMLAGPMYVVAYLLWNVDQQEASDYMRAYLYFEDIYTLDNFWGYFMDYLIYGELYSLLGWETDFYEIDFAPVDLLCYNLNGYDPTDSNSSIPTYT